ncbi:octanoyl-[GcvH]:protein N-octanoyltransferase [Salsuginibacillus halophilus]|uniref:Octanoyl-[GcvH]:protein N-octanoyltransferase n=1 Tax=Salsuginibacillus halophilus TaxID=517424 RepID=A0A2P8HI33_9BACI|nr:lipoate--protein ligase family protein [Salsuginibacillus halophilus]PSL45867.1 octanoyl-[GcvH]:protein N-octanoyltransferase [Salsuginibacillus halophilus]
MNQSTTMSFTGGAWRWLDHSVDGLEFEPLDSFALDDTLCTTVGQGISPPAARLWVHPPTVVLGIQDSRLPDVKAGIEFLQAAGYHVIVRNSGGLAVVLDEGVLNISLIMQEPKQFSIDEGYDFMFHTVQRLFADAPGAVEAGEVVGSYCPGAYDVSIGGKKFAGLSQRRKKGGAAVQVYLAMDGSGSERAELIRRFYEIADGPGAKYDVPVIEPETMASLSELYGHTLDVTDGMQRLEQVMRADGAGMTLSALRPEETEMFQKLRGQIYKRAEKSFTDAGLTWEPLDQ